MATGNLDSTWSEQEVVQKVLRRAEVSRIARVLQHRLALATYKTKHGLEKFNLDTIEPRVEEDLKRKRSTYRYSEPPGHFGEGDLEWLKEHHERGHAQEHGPSGNRSPRKRQRPSSSDPQLPAQKRPSVSWSQSYQPHGSSARYKGQQYARAFGLTQHPTSAYPTQMDFRSSPPSTPPRQLSRSSSFRSGGDGGDVFIYLSASPSPAQLLSKSMPFTPTTPPSKSAALPSSMMTTPGAPQTPHTTFNFSDFVNITPSPAQAAFPPGSVRTPLLAHARKRLNFDNIVPPSGSPGMNMNMNMNMNMGLSVGGGPRLATIGVLEIGGELVK